MHTCAVVPNMPMASSRTSSPASGQVQTKTAGTSVIAAMKMDTWATMLYPGLARVWMAALFYEDYDTPSDPAGADPDREPVEIRGVRTGLPQERIDILEERLRARDALAEHLVAVHERARRGARRRVEGQRQHSTISTALPPPACRKRTAKRGDGRTPSPASGHSTNAIASSKYGSRSPHSAGDTSSNR